jgi:eukaryotic-like serine/threonine-protein kinase
VRGACTAVICKSLLVPQEARSDRYELLEELSHGGMGDVWRGYDPVFDRPVAVKLVRQAVIATPAMAEEFAKRFRREARVTARIQHPGVPASRRPAGL